MSRAAENLGTGQPALSRTLKELAELLSTRLFDCTKGGLELTDAGKIFLKYASGGMALSQTVIFWSRWDASLPSIKRPGFRIGQLLKDEDYRQTSPFAFASCGPFRCRRW
ncbi:LysR family transcriptional regulator [Hoeflea sp. WL0058]|uniref:LysR family transcriptional regulator n=1 Tax=Flavimaribacter sediminis TaxID=2865987 RepID=A0AAE2ZKY5_9HYPH|nr:LysR family transcriptional regulator [Flavimaribacter sediminis]